MQNIPKPALPKEARNKHKNRRFPGYSKGRRLEQAREGDRGRRLKLERSERGVRLNCANCGGAGNDGALGGGHKKVAEHCRVFEQDGGGLNGPDLCKLVAKLKARFLELKSSEETMEKIKECVPSPGSSFGLRGSPVPDESSPRPRSELCNELADGAVTKKKIREGKITQNPHSLESHVPRDVRHLRTAGLMACERGIRAEPRGSAASHPALVAGEAKK